MADAGKSKIAFYIVKDGGRAKLIGTTDVYESVGRHILALLAKRDMKAAARWKDWVGSELQIAQTKVLPTTAAKVFKPLAGETLSRDAIELSAALLLVKGDAKTAVPILRRCSPPGDEVKKLCLAQLAIALDQLGEWTELAEVERQLAERDPAQVEAIVKRARALVQQGKVGDAAGILDGALTHDADDIVLLRGRTEVAIASGKEDDARAWLDKLVAHPGATALDFNNAAWARLFLDTSPARARELAATAERMESSIGPMLANTIAAIEAESEHPAAAWRYLLKSLPPIADDAPRDDDWYVFGRIAESYGLRDDAIAAYRHVAKPKQARSIQTGYTLAQKGLMRLGAGGTR